MVQLSEDGAWHGVSLRLMGDNLPVDEIEGKLCLIPSSIGREGEHFRDNPLDWSRVSIDSVSVRAKGAPREKGARSGRTRRIAANRARNAINW
jgi:hypothetical protein